MKVLNVSFLVLIIFFITPLIFSQESSSAPHHYFGSLVITRKDLLTNQIKALVLNLNSGTLINSDHTRFQVSKEALDKVVDLLKKLDISGGSLDLRDSSIPAQYDFFMANTQFGKSIIWQDGTEGDNEILNEVEDYFNSYASQKNAENIFKY
ncbi:hypothetical protein ACTFIZ_005359 [Dictyostelium cf. discoideum]